MRLKIHNHNYGKNFWWIGAKNIFGGENIGGLSIYNQGKSEDKILAY